MKKFLSLILAVLLVLSLAACGGKPTQQPQNNNDTPPAVEQTPEQDTPAAPAKVTVTDMIGREGRSLHGRSYR